jgi:hypothetical protein
MRRMTVLVLMLGPFGVAPLATTAGLGDRSPISIAPGSGARLSNAGQGTEAPICLDAAAGTARKDVFLGTRDDDAFRAKGGDDRVVGEVVTTA